MSKAGADKSVMNKANLIDCIHDQANITKVQAKQALDAILDNITSELKRGGKVSIIGFGVFEVRHRDARTGRNPQTGETIKIAASKSPAFKPGKILKHELKKTV